MERCQPLADGHFPSLLAMLCICLPLCPLFYFFLPAKNILLIFFSTQERSKYSLNSSSSLSLEGFHSSSVGKESTCNARDTGDSIPVDSIPGLGRFPGGEKSNPLQCSCLKNPMDRRAWWATEYQGRGSLVGCRLWGHTGSDTPEVTQQQQQQHAQILNSLQIAHETAAFIRVSYGLI